MQISKNHIIIKWFQTPLLGTTSLLTVFDSFKYSIFPKTTAQKSRGEMVLNHNSYSPDGHESIFHFPKPPFPWIDHRSPCILSTAIFLPPLINEMISVISYKSNKIRRLWWLITVENGSIILTKNVATVIRNWILRLRVRKLENWEVIFVDINEHQSVPTCTSGILILTVGAATNATGEGVVYGLNLL